ncbi:MAG: APC family permease [Gammaproteobacteria bacterium]
MSEPTLKRDIGYTLLTLYGLGTILGAGIYVLVGEVARSAGPAAPSAFLVSALLAGVTAFSYSEFASRLPRSAGEAAYVEAGFGRPAATTAVGWAVIATGIVSAAAMARGFVGYLDVFVSLSPSLVIFSIVIAVGGLAAWGISESLMVAGAVTILEVAGLILVCIVGGDNLANLQNDWRTLLPRAETASWLGILSGGFIAFYAFIGFEDMVNVAEEVKEPRTTLPRAIITALVVSTTLYFIVATVAVVSLPINELAGSAAPLARIVEAQGVSPHTIGFISLFAVINGALVQLIMASRVLYGLASQDLAWSFFKRVHPRTRTPVNATLVATILVLVLALSFSLERLARVTSFVALGIFTAVNIALLRLKRRDEERPPFSVPIAVPVCGALLCGGMMLYQIVELLSGGPE